MIILKNSYVFLFFYVYDYYKMHEKVTDFQLNSLFCEPCTKYTRHKLIIIPMSILFHNWFTIVYGNTITKKRHEYTVLQVYRLFEKRVLISF